MASTYYVPVERKSFAADSPLRWFHLVVETDSPVAAIIEATRIVRDDMKLRNTAVWAAVRDIPSFTYMQELRESYGRTSRKGSKVVAGYSS